MLLVAAERNIYIIAEKAAKRHVPPTPELRHRFGNIRIVEVFREAKAENFAESDRHIAVAGKIEIQLDNVHKAAKPCG